MRMKRKFILSTAFFSLLIISSILIWDYGSKALKFNEKVTQAGYYLRHYFGGTLEHVKNGQIVFSFGCTAKKLLQDSTIKLPYELNLETNILTVSQFVNMPSQFEFRDNHLGFTIDQASWGHFKFKGDTQEFIELDFLTTPVAVKMKDGVEEIKNIIQKIDAAGWKRATGFEGSLANLDFDSIEKRLKWDQNRERDGAKLMEWESKNYQVNLEAALLPDNEYLDMDNYKVTIAMNIKKI